MNRHTLYAPLRLQPRSSRQLAVFLALSHSLAALALLPIALPFWLKLALWSLLAGSFHWSYVMQVSRGIGAAIVAAEWDAEGNWALQAGVGERTSAHLQPDSLVTRPLVILNFKTTGRWRRRSLVLTADNTDPEVLRQLRVRLRLAYGKEGRDDPAP